MSRDPTGSLLEKLNLFSNQFPLPGIKAPTSRKPGSGEGVLSVSNSLFTAVESYLESCRNQ